MSFKNKNLLLASLAVGMETTVDDGNQDYAEFVGTLSKDMGSTEADMMHMAVGISGEAGELLDAVKKVWVYNKQLDRTNIIEELGDLEFYMQGLRLLVGATREEVLEANYQKLMVRYQGAYSDEKAQERVDKNLTFPELEVIDVTEQKFEGTTGKVITGKEVSDGK